MYPKIFGVIDSYSLMLLLGALAAILASLAYMKHIKKLDKKKQVLFLLP